MPRRFYFASWSEMKEAKSEGLDAPEILLIS